MRFLWVIFTGLALGVFCVMAIGTVGIALKSNGGAPGRTPLTSEGPAPGGSAAERSTPEGSGPERSAPEDLASEDLTSEGLASAELASEGQQQSPAVISPKTALQSAPAGAYAPDRGADLPVPFHLWLDSYPSDPDPSVWSWRYRRALAFYTADWGLPAEEPDQNGALSQALTDHIKRRHPDRAPQFVTTVDGCKVWIANPMAQETVSWGGPCRDGFAEGEGILLRTYQRIGEAYEAGYQGPMKAGFAEGQGVRLTTSGWVYRGDFKDGLFHGTGELIDTLVEGTDVYTGKFVMGFPDGPGRYESQGRVSEGAWSDGCFIEDGRVKRWVLRHDVECGYHAPQGGSPLRMLERLLGGDSQ